AGGDGGLDVSDIDFLDGQPVDADGAVKIQLAQQVDRQLRLRRRLARRCRGGLAFLCRREIAVQVQLIQRQLEARRERVEGGYLRLAADVGLVELALQLVECASLTVVAQPGR